MQAALTQRQEMPKDLFDETFDAETDEEQQQEPIELSSDDEEGEPVHEPEVEDDESEDEQSEDEQSEDEENEDDIVEEEETSEEDEEEDQNLVIEEWTMDAMDVDLCNIPTVAPPSDDASDDEPKVLFGETQVRLNEYTLSQDCGIAIFPSDDERCGFDRLQQAIESGILTKHAWKNGGFVVEVRGVFDHFYPVRRSGDNTKGYRLSSDYMRKTMHNDVEQIKIDTQASIRLCRNT